MSDYYTLESVAEQVSCKEGDHTVFMRRTAHA